MIEKDFVLKHAWSPVLAMPIFLGAVFILLVILTFGDSDLTWMTAFIPIAVIYCSLNAVIQLRYKIWFSSEHVIMQASDGGLTNILLNEMEKIEQEVSDARTFISLRRPFRRISIYGNGKFIDVSLKHFKHDDIRRMMKTIHEARPDLTMPNHWI